MEYIIADVENKVYVKVNDKISKGIAFLKIFETEAEAKDYLKEKFSFDNLLEVFQFEGVLP